MRYAIILDDVQLETFSSDVAYAINKYEEIRDEYKGEDIYDTIELIKMEIIKTDSL